MISYQNKADFIQPNDYTIYSLSVFLRELCIIITMIDNTLEYIKSYDKSRSVLVVAGITNHHTTN